MSRVAPALAGVIVLALTSLSCGSSAGETVAESATSAPATTTTDAPATTAEPTTTLTASTTTSAAPTTTEAPAIVIDEDFLAEQVAKSSKPDRPGAVMIVVYDANGDRTWSGMGDDPSGAAPEPDDAIRIGSITKTFTSLTVLTMIEDGLVELDGPAADYLTRVEIDPRIRVRDLLQHTSGLPDSTEVTRFISMVEEDPARVWSAEDTFGLADDIGLAFEPGSQASYSNNNYTALGVLIEEVSGQPFHVALRERILDPLELSDTYLGHFEEGAEPYGGYVGITAGTTSFTEPIVEDYTSYATVSWAGGGLVSTARDLHTLMSALFDGSVISPDLVEEMIANPDDGFGIYAPEWTTATPLRGHDGRIAGAGTWLLHAPETGMTVFTMSNANYLLVSPATEDVAIAIAEPSTTIVPR